MRLTALWGTILVGVIAGCGGGGGGGGGAGSGGAGTGGAGIGGPVSLEALPAAYAKAVCDQNFKCSKAEDIGEKTKQDCLDNLTSGFLFVLPQIRAAQTKNRLTYDGAKMATCISGLEALSCADWNTGLAQPAGCNDAFIPRVAVGGACLNDAECIGGTCENADSLADPPVDGACRAQKMVAHGEACAIEDKCPTGDYCDGTCKSEKPSGDACTSDDECGYSCNQTTKKCSTYAGCAIAPVTGTTTLLSLLAVSLLTIVARRRKHTR
jgi:hypothetical protein